jgi:D-alanine-D-alanine ligase
VNEEQFGRSALAKQPFVLKPNDGGSSIDTFIMRDPQKVNATAIKQAFSRHKTMLLQELINGVEITVAVTRMNDHAALPVIEIIPPADGEFDYENKYNGKTQELCPPEHVGRENQRKAQALAKQVHDLTRCQDVSRTDMIITPDDKIYILETNTMPGMTEESLVPKAAAADGISMSKLCSALILNAKY